MRFHFSPRSQGVYLDVYDNDVFDGRRPVYIRGFISVAAACAWITSWNPLDRLEDGSWTR